jgi:hypothetical protein
MSIFTYQATSEDNVLYMVVRKLHLLIIANFFFAIPQCFMLPLLNYFSFVARILVLSNKYAVERTEKYFII